MKKIDNRRAKAHARLATANGETHKGSDISSYAPPSGEAKGKLGPGAKRGHDHASMGIDGPTSHKNLGKYKRGGRVSGKTNINIVIAPQGGQQGQQPIDPASTMPPAPPMMAPPMPPPGAGPGGPPPMMPPGAMPPPPQIPAGRARGGRTGYKTGGAVRSESTEMAKSWDRAKKTFKGTDDADVRDDASAAVQRTKEQTDGEFKKGGRVMNAGSRSAMGRLEKAKGYSASCNDGDED